jgi:hypothetical protein
MDVVAALAGFDTLVGERGYKLSQPRFRIEATGRAGMAWPFALGQFRPGRCLRRSVIRCECSRPC